ncbi:Bax inhibitor-1/YccA family protein [Phycicoccus sp. 3266]|jgi:uncharacterized YccA/Bax inhibitor family protein|uniref:Bax inhibitor-1/YccA family protein n=1 Tax=Phycicoccus sp. 3266 TaxID=2817751 RepID=UPI002857A917|nr:Bax inhibitor-1/YccA family protein [Phycicoccus sp. 3266]MDR6862561.1 putative YccA/Bax inhibitor family protein [Phycicoccus sp. 3266]
MASNPVFDRIDKESRRGYAGFGRAPQQPTTSWGANDAMSQRQLEDLYNGPSAGPVQTGRVTIDDVIMKTASLFAILLVFAFVGWNLPVQMQMVGLLGGIAVTLVLGLVIAFKKTISVPLILLYAVAEGVFVGVISNVYHDAFPLQQGQGALQGIVPQAVMGTLAVFAGMLVAYKTGVVKVTEKFRRVVTFAVMGYAIFALFNFLYAWIGNHPFGLGGTGMLGFGISIFAIGLASLMLAVDFDSIDRAVAAGAPQKYSWLLAHGLVVTLVWLYLEILRLLGRMRSN